MRSRKGLLCDPASLRLCADFSKIAQERLVLHGIDQKRAIASGKQLARTEFIA